MPVFEGTSFQLLSPLLVNHGEFRYGFSLSSSGVADKYDISHVPPVNIT